MIINHNFDQGFCIRQSFKKNTLYETPWSTIVSEEFKGGTQGFPIMPRDVSLSDSKCWNGGMNGLRISRMAGFSVNYNHHRTINCIGHISPSNPPANKKHVTFGKVVGFSMVDYTLLKCNQQKAWENAMHVCMCIWYAPRTL